MGIFDRFKGQKNVTVSSYKMVTDAGNGFYSYDGNLYQSDIVRAAIRPKVQAIGKAMARHVRNAPEGLKVNPDVYMRFLLEEPNPYMTGQMLQEKLATQLELNNNAFAYIQRDENDYPTAIYPIAAQTSEAVQSQSGEMYLRFTMKQGRIVTFRYSDVIHLRKDYYTNEIFGDSPAQALTPLMEIVSTTDQGIIKAIKNSNAVKWLLKFNQTLRPEDVKKQTDAFVKDYLSIDSDGGAAAVDAKADAIQVNPNDYVPNADQMDRTVERIYSFFNVNSKIVKSDYTENEWIAFYETAIEPTVMQLSNEFTRKLFNRRERGFGNRIMFESANLSYASMQTKLSLFQAVDRGAMSPNEWRELLGYAPVEGGDVMIRRLDTAPTTSGEGG
jgi:HK97 family phage portal protein